MTHTWHIYWSYMAMSGAGDLSPVIYWTDNDSMQAGDADQEENHYFGHKIGPRPPFDTLLIPRDAKFRGGSFYDDFEGIRGEFKG